MDDPVVRRGRGGVTFGRLLVASPELDDVAFARTVVLVVAHEDDGAVGLVLNRPSRTPVDEAIDGWDAHLAGPAVLFGGGPVEPDGIVAVARTVPGADEDDGDVADGIRLIDLDADPGEVTRQVTGLRVFAGHAGWGPGQLERELREGAWFVVDAVPDDVVSDEPERLWRDVLRRQVGALGLVATYPDDPSEN